MGYRALKPNGNALSILIAARATSVRATLARKKVEMDGNALLILIVARAMSVGVTHVRKKVEMDGNALSILIVARAMLAKSMYVIRSAVVGKLSTYFYYEF